jgi:hypothetical protein
MFTFRSSLIGECWQKMKIMKAEFEQSESGDGLQSRTAGEERVRDEQASSRMDDEGCPNPRQQPDSRQRKYSIAFATK